MGGIFSIIFEFVTHPLGLPINPLYEWVIMAILGSIAFVVAYSAVGKLGLRGNAGSAAHWTIRFVVFVILWAIARLAIIVINNWQLSLMIIGGIAAAIILSAISISIMRYVKKRRKVNSNA
ncbi:MAG: hypothetical protein IKL87_01925 [Oscillospiraceae bacterium]|nr:hypothetical protein [Oscillospiraceae bacterium]